MNQQEQQQLHEAGFVRNEEHNCFCHENGKCIRETETENQFQTGRLEEGTPIWNEGIMDLEAALVNTEVLAEATATGEFTEEQEG